MTRISDTQLSAYLDGELDQDQEAAIAAALERDSGLRARLASFARLDEAARAAFQLPEAPREDPIAARILAHRAAAARTQPQAPTFWPRAFSREIAFTALAAGLCGLAIGFGGAIQRESRDWADAVSSPARGALAQFLDTAPSGANAPLDGDAQATLILSFRAEDGRFCRQIEIEADAQIIGALACRENESWRMVSIDAQPAMEDGAFIAASGGGAIEAAIDARGGHSALDPAEENALIAAGWR